MDNFNPIIFTRRLMNNVNLALYNQSSASSSEAKANNLTSLNLSSQQPAPAPRLPVGQTPQLPIFAQGTQVELLNLDQQIAFLKQLMNLPTELKDLLKDLVKNDMKNIQSQILANLQSNLTTPAKLDAISQMLLQSSNAAVQKLMQAISTLTRAGVSDISQYKDIMNILGAVAASVSADSSQAVKQLILLYLPWLPLTASKHEPTDFSLDFLDGNSDGSEGGENVEIINVLIRTQNFGNVSAVIEILNKISGQKATVLLNCSEDFPKDMFSKLYDERIQDEGINADIITQSNKQHAKTKSEHPSVNITTQTGISPTLLLAAYTLIRLVIEIDKDYSQGNDLHQQ